MSNDYMHIHPRRSSSLLSRIKVQWLCARRIGPGWNDLGPITFLQAHIIRIKVSPAVGECNTSDVLAPFICFHFPLRNFHFVKISCQWGKQKPKKQRQRFSPSHTHSSVSTFFAATLLPSTLCFTGFGDRWICGKSIRIPPQVRSANCVGFIREIVFLQIVVGLFNSIWRFLALI